MPKTMSPSIEHCAPAADPFTIQRPAHVIGPTVAAYGIGSRSTDPRADLLVCDDVVDVNALLGRVDRGRVAADFESNLMNLLEPEDRFWNLFAPRHGGGLNSRQKKNPQLALFRALISPDFKPISSGMWPHKRILARKNEIDAASFALSMLDAETSIPVVCRQYPGCRNDHEPDDRRSTVPARGDGAGGRSQLQPVLPHRDWCGTAVLCSGGRRPAVPRRRSRSR